MKDFLQLVDDIRNAKFDDDEQAPGSGVLLPKAPEPVPTSPLAATPAAPAPAPAPAVLVPSRPRGFGAGLDDKALRRAQFNQAMAAYHANMNRAGESIYQAFGGKSPDALSDHLEAQGKQGVQNIIDRRKALTEDQALSRDQEQDDPGSSQSQIARQLVKESMPSLAASLGANFDNLSHRQITQNFPFMKELIDARAKKQKTSVDDAELGALREQAQKNHPNMDFSKLGVESIKTLLLDDQKAAHETATTTRAGESAALRKRGQEEGARHNAVVEGLGERRLGLGEQKQGFKVSQADAYNFTDVDPEHPKALTPKQAEELTDQAAAVDKVHRLGGEMKDLLAKNGGRMVDPTGTDLKLFRQKLTEMLPALTTAGGYGNFTVAHQALAHELLDDPKELANFVHNGRLQTEIDSLIAGSDQSLDGRAKSMGKRHLKSGEKPTQSKFAPALPDAAPAGGKVKVSNGKQTLYIDAADVKDAEADGFKAVR